MPHWTYVLECADGTYYTGYTTGLARRVDEHDAGDGARYTRGRTPVTLVHAEAFESRSVAMSREHAIKSLTRRQKEQLVAGERAAVGERMDPASVDREGSQFDPD